MVRTVLLILVMLAVALAAAFPFVLPAAAQTPMDGAIQLDASCDPPRVPAGVDSLITCAFNLRNGGATALANAALELQPVADVSVAPPQRRYVFSERIDGVEIEVDPDSDFFALGDVAAGAQRSLELSIIVRSTYEFGADAVVVAGPDQHEFVRRTLKIAANASASPVSLSLMYEGQLAPNQTFSFGLRISNHGSGAIDGADVEFEPGYRYSVEGDHLTRTPIAGGPGLIARYAGTIGSIAPGYVSEEPITVATAAGLCLRPNPAAVVTARLGARVVVLAALADVPSLVCGGAEEPGSVPATGDGASSSAPQPLLPALLLAAGGALCTATGLTFRRRWLRP